MAERVYYRDGDIRITTTRAVFGSKTYAVNGITSTEVVVIPPSRALPIILLAAGLLWGGFWGLLTVGAVVSPPAGDWSFPLLTGLSTALGVGLASLGVVWLFFQKPTYAVFLCTAAREVQAYVTTKADEADGIASAIDQAITQRG